MKKQHLTKQERKAVKQFRQQRQYGRGKQFLDNMPQGMFFNELNNKKTIY